MRREALDDLRCPACGSRLEEAPGDEASEIDSGDLCCGGCGEAWTADGGIPNLVYPRELSEEDAQSRRLWDRIGRFYDFIGPLTNVMRGCRGTSERNDLVRRLELTPGGVVLEVAAGTGENLKAISEQHGDSVTVFGLDLSRRMIGVAARKTSGLPGLLHLVLGNASSLPFGDGTFDAVLDGFGMKYYADKPRAMREMLRVVKPGGKVVVTDLGMPPDKTRSLRQRLMRLWIPHVDEGPPLDAVPPETGGVSLTWDAGETAYVIEFRRGAPESGAMSKRPVF